MKKFALLLLLLLLPSFAFTQTIGSANVTATGAFTLTAGQTLSLKAQIVGCPSGAVPTYQGNPISNTPNQTASSPFTADGSEVVSFIVPGNDQILCGGQNYTLYAITWLINGFPAAPTKTYRLVDGTTTNLNTATAIGFVPPILQNSIGSQCAAGYVLNGYNKDFTPICQALSSAQTVVSTSVTTSQSIQSSLTASSFIGPLTAPKINSVVYLSPSGDASGANDQAALVAALATGNPIHVNKGTYYFTGNIVISSPPQIQGDGKDNTFFDMVSPSNELFVLHYGGGKLNTESSGGNISGFTVQPALGVTPTAGSFVFDVSGLDMQHFLSGLRVHDIDVWAECGVIKTGSFIISDWFDHIHFTNFTPLAGCDGIWYDSPQPSGDIHFTDNEFSGTGAGITLVSADATWFANSKLNEKGITFTDGATGTGNVKIVDMSIEGAGNGTGCGIDFGSGGNPPNNLWIDGGQIDLWQHALCNVGNITNSHYRFSEYRTNDNTDPVLISNDAPTLAADNSFTGLNTFKQELIISGILNLSNNWQLDTFTFAGFEINSQGGSNYLRLPESGGLNIQQGQYEVNGVPIAIMPAYKQDGTILSAAHTSTAFGNLSSGSATVTWTGAAVFTGYAICIATDTTAANAISTVSNGSNQVTLTGTGTDSYQLMCVGN